MAVEYDPEDLDANKRRMQSYVLRLWQEEPAEALIALEADAHQVPGLPLEPVGRAPEVHDRVNDRLVGIEQRLDANAVVMNGREQVIDGRKPVVRVR